MLCSKGCRIGLVSTQEEVKAVLSRAVGEIVLEIARHAAIEVLQRTRLGPVAGTSEISLERASTGVCLRNNIGIVGPLVAEEDFEGGVILGAFAWAQHAQIDEHTRQGPAAKHGLYNIGAVEAIHAVGSDNSSLSVADIDTAGRHVNAVEVSASDQTVLQMVEE